MENIEVLEFNNNINLEEAALLEGAINLMVAQGYTIKEILIKKEQIPGYLEMYKKSDPSLVDMKSSLAETIETDGELLSKFIIDIEDLNLHFQPQHLDTDSFTYFFRLLKEKVSLLKEEQSLEDQCLQKNETKKLVMDTMFALMLKHIPRFYREVHSGQIVIDSTSTKWSPDYYRMSELTIEGSLREIMKDKLILDPFAGAGSMTCVIAGYGIPNRVVLSDISYSQGLEIHDQLYSYDPILNITMMKQLFRNVPSWCKPEFDRVTNFITADARSLPFANESIDLIFGDPPYGKTLKNGGVNLFMKFVPELMRVSKEGGVFMIPLKWIDELSKTGVHYEQITGDPSYGNSGYPICYIFIPKK